MQYSVAVSIVYWSRGSIVRLYLFMMYDHVCVYLHIACGEGGSQREGPLFAFCLLRE